MESGWKRYTKCKKEGPDRCKKVLMENFWKYGTVLSEIGHRIAREDLPFFLLALSLAQEGIENYLTPEEKQNYQEIRCALNLQVISVLDLPLASLQEFCETYTRFLEEKQEAQQEDEPEEEGEDAAEEN